jgi:endonuclease I
MKKIFLLFLALTLWLGTFAQIPSGYYNAAAGLSGLPLKTALYNIILGHTQVSYGNLYGSYVTTDNLPTNNVWDMYSLKADSTANYWFTNSSNSADQCGSYSGEGDCYNREHSTPASWFNDATPMYTDLFNVYPTDGYVNNRRSNYPMAQVNSPTWSSSNGSKVGPCSVTGYTGTVFEPINTFKGDFARTFFYMATRYENIVASWPSNSTECAAVYAGNNGLVFKPWYITMLLNWCNIDPVSQKEINRNNAVYAIQHNRNPFIDHPEWILAIWGPTAGINTNDKSENFRVFPMPAADQVTINDNLENDQIVKVEVYSTTSNLVQTYTDCGKSFSIDLSNYLSGMYFTRIYTAGAVVQKKLMVVK